MQCVCLKQILAISVIHNLHLNMGVYRMAYTNITRCFIYLGTIIVCRFGQLRYSV